MKNGHAFVALFSEFSPLPTLQGSTPTLTIPCVSVDSALRLPGRIDKDFDRYQFHGFNKFSHLAARA